jgi:hypothetical protein
MLIGMGVIFFFVVVGWAVFKPLETKNEPVLYTQTQRTTQAGGEGLLVGVIALIVILAGLLSFMPDAGKAVIADVRATSGRVAEWGDAHMDHATSVMAEIEARRLSNPQCYEWAGQPSVCVRWDRMAEGAPQPQP